MRKKLTGIIVIAIVAVMLTASIIVLLLTKKDDTASSTSDTTVKVLTLNSSDIAEVQVINESGGFTLVKKDSSTFKLKDKDSLPQNATSISNVITEITSVSASKLVSEAPDDLSIYGLSSPKGTVKITLNDKTEKSILVGNAAVNGDLYFKTSDSNSVYTISSYSMSCYEYNTLHFYDVSITSAATADNIDSLKLTSGGKTVYELKKLADTSSSSSSSSSAYMSTFEMVAPYKMDSNTTNLSTALTALASLGFTTAVSDDFSSANLSKYGLASPAFTLTYSYNTATATSSGSSTASSTTEPSKGSFTVYFGNKDTDGNYYAYLNGRNIIYTLASSSVKFLSFSTVDMVSTLLYLRNINTVKSMKMEGYNQSYTFDLANSNAEKTEDMIVTYNGETYPQEDFRSLYQVVIGVSVAGIGDNPGGSPVATITFTTLDGTTDVIRYYKYDDRNLFITINGKGNFYVNKTDVEKIFTNCKNYINGDKIIV